MRARDLLSLQMIWKLDTGLGGLFWRSATEEHLLKSMRARDIQSLQLIWKLDTVALEDCFGLKGKPLWDNTSQGFKRHSPGIEQHQLSLSLIINQYNGLEGQGCRRSGTWKAGGTYVWLPSILAMKSKRLKTVVCFDKALVALFLRLVFEASW